MGSSKNGRYPTKYSKVAFVNQLKEKDTKEDCITMSPTSTEGSTDNGISYINLGEEDQMEVYGYKKSRVHLVICWMGIILTVGTLRLVFHWYPHWYLYATHRRCSLEQADSVLLVEHLHKRVTEYHVEDIKCLTTDVLRETEGWCDDMEPERSGSLRLKFHSSGGVFRGEESIRLFELKKQRYIWDPEHSAFNRLRGLDYKMPIHLLLHREGLSPMERISRRAVYGLNEIKIPIASVSSLFIREGLTPFYIFQIFSLTLWFLDEYIFYALTILSLSLAGIIQAVYQSRKDQEALRSSIEAHAFTEIFYNNEKFNLAAELVVPGDIIVLPAQECVLMCDAVLITGSCIVNESTLTGESVPVTKMPLPGDDRDIYYNEKAHVKSTLFCGTKILQTRYYSNEPVLAVCIRTGFCTSKGAITRSVLYPRPLDFKFEQDTYKFVGFLGVIAFLGFSHTVYTKLMQGKALSETVIDALDLITIVVPPALPAATTAGITAAQSRLKRRASVYCTAAKAINVAGAIDCVCFDKTGTLTEDGLDMWGVVPVTDVHFDEPVHDISTLPIQSHLMEGLASCHSLTTIDGNLTGDPLDLKVFESTGWTLKEPELSDKNKFDSLVPTAVRPPLEADSDKEIGLLRQLPFTSNLLRMSVVTRGLKSSHFTLYCKGAPEIIISLCLPESVPQESRSVLQQYTQKGYRVIAVAYKELPVTYAKMQRMTREQLECNLIFLGLVILENLLKPESSEVLKSLHNADIRTIMVTGDNMHTALSVARDCGMVPPGQFVIEVHADQPSQHVRYINATTVTSSGTVKPLSASLEGKESSSVASLDTLESGLMMYSKGTAMNGSTPYYDVQMNGKVRSNVSNNFSFALTGDTWSWIKTNRPHLVPSLVTKGVVFSRMNPEHKQQLVQDLQGIGYCVAMCGDGANDCGALRAAQAGISLSENESSAACAFTAKTSSVECVVAVIREGRAALVTSFGLFKYMAAYSLTQFVSVMLLYSRDSNLSDLQFLYIDLFLISSFALLHAQTPPFPGPLVKGGPQTSLISCGPLISLFGQLLVVAIIQFLVFYLTPGFENYSVFTISSIQYILLAIVFCKGRPYRDSLIKGRLFITIAATVSLCTLYLALYPAEIVASWFELSLPIDFENRWQVLFLGLVNIITAIIIEQFIVDFCITKKLDAKLSQCARWRKPYASVELELLNHFNWPLTTVDGKCESAAMNSVHVASSNTSFATATNCSALSVNKAEHRNSVASIPAKAAKPADPALNNVLKNNCHNHVEPSHIVNIEEQAVS
nr:PREDICTED: probable cation-transporting ATPase 13A3 [Bemisia tabaci]